MTDMPDTGGLAHQDNMMALFRYAQVGMCVNSVTHDVNNLLGAIMAYTELLGMEEGLSPSSERMLGEIMGAVRRSSAMIGHLTDVARREFADVRIMTPAELVERVLDLRRYDLKTHLIDLETNIEPSLPAMACDLPRLQHALLCLLTNAIESVWEAPTRVIRLNVRRDGSCVEYVVWNSGEPMADDIRERAFKPFFTTKTGPHLGLGLVAALNGAERHEGSLIYDPVAGFVMRLPLHNRLTEAGFDE